MTKFFIVITAITGSSVWAAGPIEPWALQENATPAASTIVNPNGVQPTTGGPILWKQPEKPKEKKDDSSSMMEAVKPLIQQAMSGMSGGGDKIADDGANSGGDIFSGNSNSVEIEPGSAGNSGGKDLKNLRGCTTAKGKFQFVYGQGTESGCDPKLMVNEDMADFIDRNLGRCVGEAAGGVSFETGKIYHAGTLPSKDHLAKSPNSLHNQGLAMDINAIRIDNRVFVYGSKMSAGDRKFFESFRSCWGKAVESARRNCLSDRSVPQGTVGEEDSAHKGHLHLSLPPCTAEARAKGWNIAALMGVSSCNL